MKTLFDGALHPIACASTLLWGTALTLALGSAAATDLTAADAVRAAQSTASPDWSSLNGKSSEVLTGFGGGRLDVDPIENREALWQQGTGSLTAPGETRTIACRNATDPECRAVQVLDRGFPERPAIPDDMLLGRDEVINAIDVPSSAGGSATCKDFTLTLPGVTSTETCSLGEPLLERTCLTGWDITAIGTLSRWACSRSSDLKRDFTCETPVRPSFTTLTRHTCRYDGSALAKEREERITTSATASALFPATCRAQQQSVTEVSCSEVLTVSGAPSCTMGDVASVTARGDAVLFEDACAGFDTLTLRHTCANEIEGRRKVTVNISGATSTGTLRGTGSVTIRNGSCSAVITTTEHSCNTTDAGGLACVVRAQALVKSNGVLTGEIHAVLAYTGYTANGGLVESWADGCSALKASAKTSVSSANAVKSVHSANSVNPVTFEE